MALEDRLSERKEVSHLHLVLQVYLQVGLADLHRQAPALLWVAHRHREKAHQVDHHLRCQTSLAWLLPDHTHQ